MQLKQERKRGGGWGGESTCWKFRVCGPFVRIARICCSCCFTANERQVVGFVQGVRLR